MNVISDLAGGGLANVEASRTAAYGYDIRCEVVVIAGGVWSPRLARMAGASTVTATKHEISYSLNKPNDYILAIVEFRQHGAHDVHYLRRPFRREPDFGVTGAGFTLAGYCNWRRHPHERHT